MLFQPLFSFKIYLASYGIQSLVYTVNDSQKNKNKNLTHVARFLVIEIAVPVEVKGNN